MNIIPYLFVILSLVHQTLAQWWGDNDDMFDDIGENYGRSLFSNRGGFGSRSANTFNPWLQQRQRQRQQRRRNWWDSDDSGSDDDDDDRYRQHGMFGRQQYLQRPVQRRFNNFNNFNNQQQYPQQWRQQQQPARRQQSAWSTRRQQRRQRQQPTFNNWGQTTRFGQRQRQRQVQQNPWGMMGLMNAFDTDFGDIFG